MARFEGSLARRLDFGDTPVEARFHAGVRAGLRLASPGGVLRGPDKYKVLERRRRHAQIKARHALSLIDMMERR